MKKIALNINPASPTALMLVFLLSLTPAFATDWIYDLSKTTATWTESVGTASTNGYWYYLNGEDKVYMNGWQTAYESDSFSIGSKDTSVMTSNVTLNLDTDVTVNNFTMASSAATSMVKINGTSSTVKFTVNGDFTNATTAGIAPKVEKLDVHIKGNFNVGAFWLGMINCYQVKIDGNLISVNTQPEFSANGTAKLRYGTPADTFENGLASPDVIVKGVSKDANSIGIVNPSGYTGDLYCQFGGLTGVGTVWQRGLSKGRTLNLILKLDAGVVCSTAGVVREEIDIYISPVERARTRIIMDSAADAVQTINFSYSQEGNRFSGGLVLMGGTFKTRFDQPAAKYALTANYKNVDRGDTAAVKYNVTFSTGTDASAQQTTFSHGDLTMQNGTFASPAEKDKYFGSFRFTNIVYSGGTIKLRLQDETHIDSIDLTSYFMKEVDSTNAERVFYTKQEGGSVKFAEGVKGTKVVFDFGTSSELMWLIDPELNDGKGAKIISWDAANKTALSSKDFYAEGFRRGDDYEAIFTITDDGLYVKYSVAVPEAATVGMLFGAMALLYSTFRRRK